MHGTHSRGRNLSDWRLPSRPVGSQRARRWPPCTVVVSLLCSAPRLLAACAVGVHRRRCRGGRPTAGEAYRRTTRVLAPGKCDVRPRSTAGTGAAGGEGAREREEEVEEEEDNDGNEDGHEDDRRGPPTTRRCRARRFRRRAATCDGPVGKPTGSPCRRERVSERASKRANERASERARENAPHARNGEGASETIRACASERERGRRRRETKTALQDLVGWRYRSRRRLADDRRSPSPARLCSSGLRGPTYTHGTSRAAFPARPRSRSPLSAHFSTTSFFGLAPRFILPRSTIRGFPYRSPCRNLALALGSRRIRRGDLGGKR